MVLEDDGWAYARTVQRLLQTGEYRLDEWAAANMPVQIYWGALLCKTFGYSLPVLYFSTTVLSLAGLLAFYALLRDFGCTDLIASLLVLVLFSCPLVLALSHSFMTDMQFMAWLLISLWLYARAFRRNSLRWMLVASCSCAAAIGTRQFGIALLGGVAVTWLLKEKHRFQAFPFYLAGCALPLAATVWQLSFGLSHPTFTQAVRLHEQSLYMRISPLQFVEEIAWRPGVILEYLGIFTLPLLLTLGVFRIAAKRSGRSSRPLQDVSSRRVSLWIAAGWIAYLAIDVIYMWKTGGLPKSDKFYADWMPSLPWMLSYFLEAHQGGRFSIVLTVFSALLAVGLGIRLSHRIRQTSFSDISRRHAFLLSTGALLFILHLLYVQLNDTYLVAMLPFVLLAFSPLVKNWPNWSLRLTTALALLLLGASAGFLRGRYNRYAAVWAVAEKARASGTPPKEIFTSWHWQAYYSLFDQWAALASREPNALSKYSGPYQLHEGFFHWIKLGLPANRFMVFAFDAPPHEPQFMIVGRVAYSDAFFRTRYVYELRRSHQP